MEPSTNFLHLCSNVGIGCAVHYSVTIVMVALYSHGSNVYMYQLRNIELLYSIPIQYRMLQF